MALPRGCVYTGWLLLLYFLPILEKLASTPISWIFRRFWSTDPLVYLSRGTSSKAKVMEVGLTCSGHYTCLRAEILSRAQFFCPSCQSRVLTPPLTERPIRVLFEFQFRRNHISDKYCRRREIFCASIYWLRGAQSWALFCLDDIEFFPGRQEKVTLTLNPDKYIFTFQCVSFIMGGVYPPGWNNFQDCS